MKFLKGLVNKVKSLLASRETDHAERIGPPTHRRTRRKGVRMPKAKVKIAGTPFQIAWETLRQKRIERGLPVSGFTRTCLRARLRGRTV